MKRWIFVILGICYSLSLTAQEKDPYEAFQARIDYWAQFEKIYRAQLKHEACTGEDSVSIIKALRKINKDKAALARKVVDENRNDERFLKVYKRYLRRELTLKQQEKELRAFGEEVQKTEAFQESLSVVLAKQRRLPGNICLDFETKDHEGNPVKFSDVYRKNVLTVLDFWASWCWPCRASMPGLKKIYQKYKNKGLEVVSYSIDRNKKTWDKAYKELGLPWIDCSDLLDWDNSPVSLGYGVTAVPTKFLVDANGVILWGDEYGQESLEVFIEKYLAKRAKKKR